MPNATFPRHDWPAIVGVAVVAAAAVVLSFSALAGLGRMVGFGKGLPLHWLVPLCIDAYGATATRIAVASKYGEHTRSHALVHAIAAIVISVLGNATYHLIETGVVAVGDAMWALVVAVSVIPPLALGALAHLLAMCARDIAAARVHAVPTAAAAVPVDGPADAAEAEGDDAIAPPPMSAVPEEPFDRVPDVPEPREVYLRAVEVFADDLARGEVPPIRDVKAALRCGQPRATEVRAYLGTRVTA